MDIGLRATAVRLHLHVPHANGLLSVRKRAMERRRADELLLSGAQPDGSALSTRAADLTSACNRRVLARSLERTVRELEGRVLPSTVPLNRAGAQPHVDLIGAVAVRLRAADPVSARGVLLVQELLSDGYGSPLYSRERVGDLGPTLEACLSALEPNDEGTR